MISKSYIVSRDNAKQTVPLSLFFEEHGLKLEDVDLSKLEVDIDLDLSFSQYNVIQEIGVVINYDN